MTLFLTDIHSYKNDFAWVILMKAHKMLVLLHLHLHIVTIKRLFNLEDQKTYDKFAMI